MKRLLATAVLALSLATAAGAAEAPVRTTGGLVRGASAAEGVRVFKGLPYAAPPVGPLRWRPPAPAAGWTGVRAADAFGPACPQKPRGENSLFRQPSEDRQSEDCLYLNVWTPAKRPGDRLPVMVWIHGGGFANGSGANPTYDGVALARRGVVLVTLNYRLGPLGFLVHPELSREAAYHGSGNYGLMDQVAALKWVRANIAAFGGDPSRVTIFGESAGSGSVNILQASPLAKGLFRRAIGESTSQMDPASGLLGRQSLAQGEAAGVKYAADLGANNLADLRRLPAEAFLKPATQFWPQEKDGYVLPDEVQAIFAKGRQNRVDLIVGSNAQEGSNLRAPWVRPDAGEKAAFDRFYTGPMDPQASTDAVHWQMRSWAGLHAKSGGRTFLYWFEHAPPVPVGRYRENDGKPLGAYHASEIGYVFGNLIQPWPWAEADRRLSDLMSRYWVNFARTGDPNGPGLPAWPRYDPRAPQVMRLSDKPGAQGPVRPEAQVFLDAYFDKRR
jgi:para-nitrobenzyl esterase